MKVRVGLGLNGWPFVERHPRALLGLVEQCEELKIDSLWFSDRIVSTTVTLDPLTLMAFIAARTHLMKLGTSALVLPSRHPVVLAKELATLDFLSQGRLLLVVGIGNAISQDLSATGIRQEERARRTDEMIRLMRRLWTEDVVTFEGRHYKVQGVTVHPRPWQEFGPPIWIGGRSEGALRRAGRLGDGWLVSGATPQDVAQGIEAIRRYAAENGRHVPEDHYGVYIPFCFAKSQEEAIRKADSSISRIRPDIPLTTHAALGTPEQVRAKVREYLDAGATKFVMRPSCAPEEYSAQVELLGRELVTPFQTPFSREELMERAGVQE